jgi:hypothetical protein
MNERESAIETLVADCIIAHQEYILVKLISELETDYQELAKLATMGEYKKDWTHKKVLDYITFET